MHPSGYIGSMQVLDEKALKRAIGSNVFRLRKSRGWTQDELASQLGISRKHVNRIENEDALPSADLLYTLADVFDVPSDTFRQLSERISSPAA